MSFIYEAKILSYRFRVLVTLTFIFLDVCPSSMAGTDLMPPPPTISSSGGASGGDGRNPYNWQKRWVKIGEQTFFVHAEDEELLQLLSEQLEQMRNAGMLIPFSIIWGANLYPGEWIPQAIRRLMVHYPNGVTIFSASACFAGMIAYCRYNGISGALSPMLKGAGSATFSHMMFFVNLCPSYLQRPLIVGSIGASVANTFCRNAIAYHRSILKARRTTVINPQVVFLAVEQGQFQMLNSDEDVILQAQAIKPDDENDIDDALHTRTQTLIARPIIYLRQMYHWLMSFFYRHR
ncbi:hypothetical protein [Endozoicomonas sp. 8E]|uniref:hypothetical protein n=1 Tax=Endozoicomonas sp. 8E TaxID=3035692 RepID=UPI002938D316|nr:hypothetical protein [Endozoicomonas sp. 8E]WOG30253.1 hypothetical protein P6910_11605 [Endozoicomonas sp. 8E]